MSSVLSESIRTIRVGVSGTSDTESYTLAPGLAQYVEAVYVEVTNNAGSAVHPVLSISEQAGVVIAKRRQGGTISASGSGSATWALRLSGDDSGDTGLTGIFYDIDNTGDWLHIDTGASPPAGEDSLTLNVGQDWRMTIARDWDIDSIGRDWNIISGNDFNWDPGNDWNVNVGQDVNFNAVRDVNLTADRQFAVESQSTSLPGQFVWRGGANVIVVHDHTVDFWNRIISFGDAPVLQIKGSDNTDVVKVRLRTGKTLLVTDDSDNPIFQIDDSGALHGKTGQTLTFDL